mmetsp:Transcript_14636/g.17312  ORF Transcript_14636/g.17312 Transcript_14636/m.17312 type:complete len:604 (+) Transcript_14636:50-1861(+)
MTKQNEYMLVKRILCCRLCSYSNKTKLEKIDVIFDSCDANTSGKLDTHQVRYALEALGWYFGIMDMNQMMEIPLARSDFHQLVEDIDASGLNREMPAVPHARRGISLKQLKAVHAGLLGTKWLSSRCKEFNLDHQAEILNEGLHNLDENPDLYSMDKLFVMQTTSCEAKARDTIPKEVLNAADVPGVPEANCSFAQLLNPEGLDVDYFVSHFWGHPFEQTMKALTKFSEGVYEDIGKDNPDDIVFWICLFAVNQHQKAKEVGASLEHAPFNVALAKANHGAVMVLDGQAKPMQRIWCLHEVSRANEFKQSFQLITDEGDIMNSNVKTLEEISECLLQLHAFDADASNQSDKIKIRYQIIDSAWERSVGSFEAFKKNHSDVDEAWFGDFDRHICSLMGTPLLAAGLTSNSIDVCTRAMRMGATVTVANLEYLTKLGVDVAKKFETKFGMVSLSFLYADMGLVDELRYILDQGGIVEEKAKDYWSQTPLHRAAEHGHTKVISLLLDRGANIHAKNSWGSTPLHPAAWNGQTETVTLLLDRGADIQAMNKWGITPLHIAAYSGQTTTLTLLLDRGADNKAKDDDNNTPFDITTRPETAKRSNKWYY